MELGCSEKPIVTYLQKKFPVFYARTNLQLWGPRGNQNVEAPINNNKLRLRKFQFYN
jgi:pseudouridine-5'-phosphate glycosidase